MRVILVWFTNDAANAGRCYRLDGRPAVLGLDVEDGFQCLSMRVSIVSRVFFYVGVGCF